MDGALFVEDKVLFMTETRLDCAEHHRQAIKEEERREGQLEEENYVSSKMPCILLGEKTEMHK